MVTATRNKPEIKRQLISPVLTVICLVLMLLLGWLWPIVPILPFPYNLAGLFIGSAGLAISFTAHRQFKKIGTTLYPFNKPEKLITDGLFRYTRNPMYLGLTLFLTGIWLLLGSLSPLGMVVAFQQIADRWYITREERQLMAVFGKAYVTYQTETPRWI